MTAIPPDLVGPTTLAVDELLDTLTAEQWQQLTTAAAEHVPGWRAWADQAAAAADDATAAMTAAAVVLGGTGVVRSEYRATPEWIRLNVLSAYVGWAAGKASTCMHNPTAARPEPVFAAAWKPGLVTCARCPHLLELPRGSAKDRTCDGCGRVTTGPEHGDGIHPSRIQYGPMMLAFGTCEGCTPAGPHQEGSNPR